MAATTRGAGEPLRPSAEKAPLLSHGAAAHDDEEGGVAGLVFRLEKRVASLVVAVAALAVVVLVAGISLVAVSPSPQLQHHPVVTRQWSQLRDPGEVEAANVRALNAAEQPGEVLWKTVTNPKKRLVFFMGAEGTGHHFFINQVSNGPLTTRTFGRDYCSDPANAELCELCAVHECAMTGVDISPELFEDVQQGADHLYDFITPWNGKKANKDVLNCVNNPKYAWELPSSEDSSARLAMSQRPGYVSCKDATLAFLSRFARAPVAPADRPSYMVVNARFSYGQFQLDSYPTLMHPQYPVISLFARLAEAAKVDLRVLVMLRDPVRALRSVAARFGTGGGERPDSANRAAPQVVHEERTRKIANGALLELAKQAYGVMTDQLSKLDTRFYTCWVYDPGFPLETSIFNTPGKRSVQEFFDLRSDEIHSLGANFKPSNGLNAEFGKWGDRDTELVTLAAQAYISLGGEAFWHSKEYIKVPIMNGVGAGTTAGDGLPTLGFTPLMSRVDFQVRNSMKARVSFLKQAELELGRQLMVQEVEEFVRKENELYKAYWMFRSSFCGHIPVDYIGV